MRNDKAVAYYLARRLLFCSQMIDLAAGIMLRCNLPRHEVLDHGLVA
jgi:hypothetical protein